ncbi:MAG: alpha/beta hydrolase [Desulfobacteraceae bacterium]|jgi:pimeloyl-ACP methyl ester carboxylesterase|nr:alpha/beta hydrolase [Desulfobacteraceae bacterium]
MRPYDEYMALYQAPVILGILSPSIIAMSINSFHYVKVNGIQLCFLRWGDPKSKKPPALLVHGTGFVAATWRPIAEALMKEYVVFAIDRRGHGRSTVPKKGYEFLDFAEDLAGFIEALGIQGAYGIGHSAGATDILLAAGLLPHGFARVFAMEPTVQDPTIEWPTEIELSEKQRAVIESRRRRCEEFASRDEVFERYSSRPPLNIWRSEILQEYVAHGFKEVGSERVRLRCSPDIEATMIESIYRAMANCYHGDWRGDPFSLLLRIHCPVTVSSSAHSPAIYRKMAEIAARVIPHARLFRFDRAGHYVPQANPEMLLDAIRKFAQVTLMRTPV